jgi:tRNA-dihydrouridine synthase
MEGCLRQLGLLATVVGESVAVREMRKHVAWYLKGLPRAATVKESANRATTAIEIEELLLSYLGRLESGEGYRVEEAWSEPVGV